MSTEDDVEEIVELKNEIAQLRKAMRSARIQLSALGGTAGVHMSDDDAAETGCDMIQRAIINQIDNALEQ